MSALSARLPFQRKESMAWTVELMLMWALLAHSKSAMLTTATGAQNFEITEDLARYMTNVEIYLQGICAWQLGPGKRDAM